MIVGVTGHQAREGIDWTWVQTELLSALEDHGIISGLSSLASGTDQLFAAATLQLRAKLVSVLPVDRYEDEFEGDARRMYRFLRDASEQVNLSSKLPREHAFLAAGKYIVDNCELLIAVWDGQPAEGIGGTADIVAYAKQRDRKTVLLDPVSRQKTAF